MRDMKGKNHLIDGERPPRATRTNFNVGSNNRRVADRLLRHYESIHTRAQPCCKNGVHVKIDDREKTHGETTLLEIKPPGGSSKNHNAGPRKPEGGALDKSMRCVADGREIGGMDPPTLPRKKGEFQVPPENLHIKTLGKRQHPPGLTNNPDIDVANV